MFSRLADCSGIVKHFEFSFKIKTASPAFLSFDMLGVASLCYSSLVLIDSLSRITFTLMLDLLEDKQCSSVGGFDVTNLYISTTSLLAILLSVLSQFCVHLARLWCLLVVSSIKQVTRSFGIHLEDFWPR